MSTFSFKLFPFARVKKNDRKVCKLMALSTDKIIKLEYLYTREKTVTEADDCGKKALSCEM